MNIIQAFYDLEDIVNDTIDSIGALPINAMDAASLAAAMPGLFTIENNTNNSPKLCVSKIEGQDLELSVNIGTGNAYTIKPEPFIPVYIIGPHPVKVFSLKPGGKR